MHRIDTKTAQKDKFGAGKNGFTRGNPQTGTPATDLDDDYFALAEMERELIVERTKAGLEAARAQGRIGGRRPKLTPEQWAQAGRLIASGVPRQKVAIIYDVGISTLYKKFPVGDK